MDGGTGTQPAWLHNRCAVDEQVLERAYSLIFRGRRLFILLLAAVFFVLAIVFQAMEGFHSFQPINLALVVLTFFYLVVALTLPSRFARQQLRRIQESRGVTSFTYEVTCTPEELLNRADFSQDSFHCRYEDIKRVQRDGGLILIQTKARQFDLLDADRFENGTEADFWALLAEKRPGLKLPAPEDE